MMMVKWMPFDSDQWFGVLVDAQHTVDQLVRMLTNDEGIRRVQVLDRSSKTVLDKEWVYYGAAKR